MFNTLKKRIKNEKGLSLVELLAVIVILGIIAAIAIPAIGNIINNQRDKAILAEASNILSGAKIAHTEGVCDAESTDADADACNGAVLDDYIDGVKITAATVVTLSEGVWSIDYENFSNITEGSKFTPANNPITEEDLNDLLD